MIRAVAIYFALKQRKQELAQDGLSTYYAYILLRIAGLNKPGGGFKPGAKERMENEMRVLSERIDRINRRGGFLRLMRRNAATASLSIAAVFAALVLALLLAGCSEKEKPCPAAWSEQDTPCRDHAWPAHGLLGVVNPWCRSDAKMVIDAEWVRCVCVRDDGGVR